MLRGVYVGHHERSGAAIFLTSDGVKRERNKNCKNDETREMGSRAGRRGSTRQPEGENKHI